MPTMGAIHREPGPIGANDKDTANGSQFQCNPLSSMGILYGTSPRLKLLALTAATGDQF